MAAVREQNSANPDTKTKKSATREQYSTNSVTKKVIDHS